MDAGTFQDEKLVMVQKVQVCAINELVYRVLYKLVREKVKESKGKQN